MKVHQRGCDCRPPRLVRR